MAVSKSFFKISKKNYLDLLPKIKEEKTQTFTTIALTLLALSFFGIFAISPTLSTIAQLKKQISDNLYVDKKLGEKITNLGILSQKYSALDADIPIVLAAVPQNSQAPLLLTQIEAMAQKNNLEVIRLQSYLVELTKIKEDPSDYSSFTFSIEGQASSYENIENFLSSLINFDRIISIDVISVSSRADKNATLRISIRGKAFFKQ
ncbi:MAG: type 4a pilus biogenesis protein PilO [Candidatus Levybacteria bacterium]|nr:type 4a pilus biogenesis protein PilO [Candidatus Levybacteria bacterium]